MKTLKDIVKEAIQTDALEVLNLQCRLGMPAEDLLKALENGTLEFRQLEMISKELGISLYSMVCESSDPKPEFPEQHYKTSVNSTFFSDLMAENARLRSEINELKGLLEVYRNLHKQPICNS